MRDRPRIALSKIGDDVLGRWLGNAYALAVSRASGRPDWVSGETSGEDYEALAARYDGFLFTGGADIDPSLYGAVPSAGCGKSDLRRDRFEPRLLLAAFTARKPILGICRGCQLINVVLGGSLHQDLKRALPRSAARHFRAARLFGVAHDVKIAEGSLLSRCLGVDRLGVNSVHHQALATVSPALLTSGVGDDGIVEGLEAAEHPFLLGVQWHPELLAARYPAHQRLFDRFVAAAGGGGDA